MRLLGYTLALAEHEQANKERFEISFDSDDLQMLANEASSYALSKLVQNTDKVGADSPSVRITDLTGANQNRCTRMAPSLSRCQYVAKIYQNG